MDGDVLVDTNIVTELIRGDEELQSKAEEADGLLVPVVVVGELLFGAYKSTRVDSNLEEIYRFLDRAQVLDVETAIADEYGKIKHELRVKGRPIPDNDIWIAALGRHHGLGIATRDTHFDQVDGIQVLRW
jgi:tRNA(fMet)-specific endonuclease VapC